MQYRFQRSLFEIDGMLDKDALQATNQISREITSTLRAVRKPAKHNSPMLSIVSEIEIESGQQLAGRGALIFEGERLDLPGWQ